MPDAANSPHAPDPSASPSVLRALLLLRSAWARDFIFSPRPVDDVLLLTAAASLPHACAGEHLAVLESAGGNRNRLRETDGLTQWVFVPAFNAGGLCSTGYLATRSKRGGRARGVTGGELNSLYRSVRDDAGGQLLTVCDVPGRNMVQFGSLQLESATRRVRHYGVARRDALLAALEQPGAPTESQLSACLMSCLAVRERRLCPACRAADCACALAVTPPAHATDFRHSVRNLAIHCGAFFGTGVLTQGAHPRKFLSQSSIDGGSDPGLTKLLVEWAVQRRMAVVTATPQTASIAVQAQAAGMVFAAACRPAAEGNRVVQDITDQVENMSLEAIVDILSEEPADESRVQERAAEPDAQKRAQKDGSPPRAPLLLAPRGFVPQDPSQNGKEMQRKIQKRLAAQRNDKRRSENFKKLKQSLADAKAEMKRLSERKQQLSEENQLLREKWREQSRSH